MLTFKRRFRFVDGDQSSSMRELHRKQHDCNISYCTVSKRLFNRYALYTNRWRVQIVSAHSPSWCEANYIVCWIHFSHISGGRTNRLEFTKIRLCNPIVSFR